MSENKSELFGKINADMKQAMLAKDELKLSVIRMMKSKVLLAPLSGIRTAEKRPPFFPLFRANSHEVNKHPYLLLANVLRSATAKTDRSERQTGPFFRFSNQAHR